MGTDESIAASVGDKRDDLETTSIEETQSQCKAIAKTTGMRCKKTASPGSEYCPVHQSMAGRRAQQGNTAPTLKAGKTRTTVGDAYKMSPEEEEATPTPPEEQVEVEEGPQQASSKRKKGGEWEVHAAFSVFFDYEIDDDGERVWQTRVSDDEDDTVLEGIDTANVVNWILERANLPVEAKPIPTEAEAAAPPAPVTPYDVQIDILDADVNESSVAPRKRLVAEARFKIRGSEAETLMKKEIPFEILFRTVNRESGAANRVASQQGQLDPQTREYLGKQEFPIPDLGRYELETIILLLPSGEKTMAFRHQGPPFRVVPR